MIAHYKKFKNGLYLHGLNRLVAKPNNNRIPLRIIDEMQTKPVLTNYTIMHPDLECLTTAALDRTHSEMWMIIRVTSQRHIGKIVRNILNRNDLRQQFHRLYVGWTMGKITRLKKCKLDKMNLSEKVCDVVEGYYQMYMRRIMNRYNCYIMRSQENQKVFMPLRQYTKCESIKHSKTNPYNK